MADVKKEVDIYIDKVMVDEINYLNGIIESLKCCGNCEHEVPRGHYTPLLIVIIELMVRCSDFSDLFFCLQGDIIWNSSQASTYIYIYLKLISISRFIIVV